MVWVLLVSLGLIIGGFLVAVGAKAIDGNSYQFKGRGNKLLEEIALWGLLFGWLGFWGVCFSLLMILIILLSMILA